MMDPEIQREIEVVERDIEDRIAEVVADGMARLRRLPAGELAARLAVSRLDERIPEELDDGPPAVPDVFLDAFGA